MSDGREGVTVHRCQPSTSEVPSVSVPQMPRCEVCERSLSRSQDLKRHSKCKSEREKLIRDQKGVVQCRKCKRWFKSRGGLSVHKYILTQGDDPN